MESICGHIDQEQVAPTRLGCFGGCRICYIQVVPMALRVVVGRDFLDAKDIHWQRY